MATKNIVLLLLSVSIVGTSAIFFTKPAEITMCPPSGNVKVICDTASLQITTIPRFDNTGGTQVNISAITCRNQPGYQICTDGQCDALEMASLRNTLTSMANFTAFATYKLGIYSFTNYYLLFKPIELCMQDGCALIPFTSRVKIFGSTFTASCNDAKIRSDDLSSSAFTISIKFSKCTGLDALRNKDVSQSTMILNSYTSIQMPWTEKEYIYFENTGSGTIVLDNA